MDSQSQSVNGINLISYSTNSQESLQVLFVHGMWHGAWCWEKYFLPYFQRKGISCHALDLRSHSKSEKKGIFRLMSINDYVQDVHSVIKVLSKDGTKIVLVGHSMGGFVVQKYLSKYQDNIVSVILLAPGTTWGTRRTTVGVLVHHPLIYLKMVSLLSLYPLLANFNRFKYYLFNTETDQALLKEYHEEIQDDSFRVFIDMLTNHIAYKKILLPVLLLGAKSDQIYSEKQLRKLESKFSTIDTYFFDELGHDMMLEKGWNDVADKMISWIQKIKIT